MKQFLVIAIFISVSSAGYSQGVKWTNIEDVQDSISKEKRPIVVKIETPWCGYCKLMEKNVYSNKKFSKKMSKNYYFVRLDADSKDTISFNEKKYGYFWFTEQKGVNSLARELAEVDGVLQYPTTVVLNSDLTFNKRIVGYLNKQDFKYWLQFSEE